MSYEVNVHLKDAEKWFKPLQIEFKKIHDMKFKQMVNIDYYTGKGEVQEMNHGLCILSQKDIDSIVYKDGTKSKTKPFIYIPCHWDYNHMVQTKRDIELAARNIGVKIEATLSY